MDESYDMHIVELVMVTVPVVLYNIHTHCLSHRHKSTAGGSVQFGSRAFSRRG